MHCKIVNISSTSGVAGNAGQINYSAGKLGIVGVTKTMAQEWGQFNINVNAVYPSKVSTTEEPRLAVREVVLLPAVI